MDIRYGEADDALALSYLLARVWRVAYRGIFPQTFLDNIQDDGWVAGFEQGLANPEATTLVAEENGKIMGMIAFGKGRDAERQDQAEIYAINVSPDYQRQKIGSHLMCEALKKLGEQKVYLKVAAKNFPAQQFYVKHGFSYTQQSRIRHIADFSFDEWLFEKGI
ncbi:MAG: GNAT family N-acetyltransferase [Pasteurellaceae bacterium]|nr:GNAT family N-acetyltransferase [Pasteurellaceae bacterium]